MESTVDTAAKGSLGRDLRPSGVLGKVISDVTTGIWSDSDEMVMTLDGRVGGALAARVVFASAVRAQRGAGLAGEDGSS